MYKTANINELQNHHISTNLRRLYLNADAADVNFLFHGNRKIAAHKCLLAIASPVFQKMFFGDLREAGDVKIVDATAAAFMEFLQFFYCDKFELTLKNIGEVITMADKYDVAGLMNLCTIFLERNITIDTVCWIYELALSFSQMHIVQLCEDKICLETTSVLASDAFLSCNTSLLGRILQMNRLSCDERHLYNGAMVWATSACKRNNQPVTMDNKKSALGVCFELIRFPTMSAEHFTECMGDGDVLDTVEFLDILSFLTIKRPMKACRFPVQPRCGIPAWIRDDSVRTCDRRSMPNLKRFSDAKRDVTVFSVNERILLGQLTLSTVHNEERADVDRCGQLRINRCGDDDDCLLKQPIAVASKSFKKCVLNRPVILQPFEEYRIECVWDLDVGDRLVFRTACRDEVMIDGGVRFQFKRVPELNYDNVEEGLVMKLHFKKW